MTNRPIYAIAADIKRSWPKVNYAAKPHLDAMFSLGTIHDAYYMDSGKDIVLRFLANASTFRGEDAKRLKAELKALV
jgi:hypothetical protein